LQLTQSGRRAEKPDAMQQSVCCRLMEPQLRHSLLMFAALMMGHHFSISALADTAGAMDEVRGDADLLGAADINAIRGRLGAGLR
jgi:hypothetical protein